MEMEAIFSVRFTLIIQRNIESIPTKTLALNKIMMNPLDDPFRKPCWPSIVQVKCGGWTNILRALNSISPKITNKNDSNPEKIIFQNLEKDFTQTSSTDHTSQKKIPTFSKKCVFGFVNSFKFQPCDHTPPGTERLWFLIRCWKSHASSDLQSLVGMVYG